MYSDHCNQLTMPTQLLIPSFVCSALRGEPLQIHGDGLQTRDFTYVGNVAEVLAECVRQRISNPEPINLAFGSRVSLLAVVELLEDILGMELPRQHMAPRPGDVRDSQADQTAFRQVFPDVEAVNLEMGLRALSTGFERLNVLNDQCCTRRSLSHRGRSPKARVSSFRCTRPLP